MENIQRTSSSDSLRDHLATTQSISRRSEDQSSILGCLQDKINELLQFKEENISLRSQLQIARETCQLQEIEFTFQRKELETELENLKSIESKLRNNLAEQQINIQRTYTYEVQVTLDNLKNQCNQLGSKKQKWKNRAKESQVQIDRYTQTINKFKEEQQNQIKSQKNIADQLQQERERTSQQDKELIQLKSRIKELERQSDDLSLKDAKNGKALQKLAHEKTKNRELETQIQELKAQQLTQMRNADLENKTLSEENDNLKDQLRSINDSISVNQDTIQDYLQQNRDFKQKISQQAEQISELTRKNMQLQLLADKVPTSEKEIKDLISQIEKQKEVQQNIEIEQTSLASALGVKPDPINEQWTQMMNKVAELRQTVSRIPELESMISKLKKRLEATTDVIRNLKPESRSIIEPTNDEKTDELVQSLQVALKNSQDEVLAYKSQIDELLTRLSYATSIDKSQAKIIQQLDDLYLGITQKPQTNLRGMIMAIVFSKRLLMIQKGKYQVDPSALCAFIGRPQYSMENKIRDLRQKYTEMSHDLLHAKQNLHDALKELAQKNDELNAPDENESRLKKARNEISQLKARRNELMAELSTLIPPEKYQIALDTIKKLMEQIEDLESNIEHLKTALENRTKKCHSVQKKLKDVVLQANAKVDNAMTIQKQFSEFQTQIKTLNVLLFEKTKEILALERLVQRHQVQNGWMSSSLANTQKENTKLHMALNDDDIPCRERYVYTTVHNPNLISCATRINPAFLGDTYY